MVKVSVIVPIYNVEKYLVECIESLCAQTLKDIEIILIDDGSPDNSGKICDEYAAKDARIKVIHKKNEGVSAARNDGLTVANGEYVIFVDSDDYIPNDAYEKMYEKAKETNVDIVLGDLYQVIGEEKKYEKFFKESYVSSDREFIDKLIETVFYNTYCPMPSEDGPAYGYGGPTNKLVRRGMLKDNNIKFNVTVNGIFDDVIYSTYIFWCANSIAYISEPVYYYRIIESSITHIYKANMPEINNAIFQAFNEFLSINDNFQKFEKMYYATVVRRLEQIISKYFLCKSNPSSRKEVIKEMNKTLRMEPYRTAVKKVEVKKLIRRHKALVYFSRTKSAFLVCQFYNVKDAILKMLH